LELVPDLEEFRFAGEETITLDVVEATNELTLNALELDIHEARLRTPDGTTLDAGVRLDPDAQRLVLTFGPRLEPAEGYQLDLRFTGELNDQLHGFYRSTLTDDAGDQHVIASTQFEPADARQAFPCWDEPEYKATFAISLVVPDGLTALSNSAEANSAEANSAAHADTRLGNGWRRVTFRPTMLMSTYLVAFVVGPFELTPPDVVDGVPLRVASAPGKSHLTGFAVEAGSHALRFLSQYFGIPYPSDKIDHVAIPDFAFGAMENLGCVTYRENALLVDPAEASQLELQRVAAVISHETAHMWFGDLVTMKWWNGIWLNEAFATFMELMTDDHFRPDWQVWTAFGPSKAAALATDGLRHTRAVEFPVGNPDEAEAMFDVLTYQKGAAVLRMLEQYLAPDTFRKGIGQYLNTHAHANTETGDLWDALEAASGEPVRAIMDTWIFQGGYPLITVEPAEDDPTALTLRQSRFLYDQGAASERWQVPVRLRASVGGEIQQLNLLLDADRTTVRLDGPVDWVIANDGGWGFYRVRYAPSLMAALQEAGIPTVCDPLERLSLVIDSWAAVVSGAAGLDEWVAVIEALGTEDDPDVWAAIRSALDLLDLMADDEDRAALQAFVRRVAGRAWAQLGWDPSPGEPERLGTTRGRVLAVLGGVGEDRGIRAQTEERFGRFLSGGGGLAPDLLTPAARVVATFGGQEAWETILGLYRTATTPQDKVRYLDALAATSDPGLLARTLDLALSDDVRTQDAAFLVGDVMGSRAGGRLAWQWLERRWDDLQGRLPGGLIARIFDAITALVEPDLAAQVHAFMASHEVPHAGPRIDQVLERMDINVGVAARIRGTIARVLSGASVDSGPGRP
jgi:puromycin-sensitive aminopeptidase